MGSTIAERWLYEFEGDPTGLDIDIINPPIGAIIFDPLTGHIRHKTTGLGDNSGYAFLSVPPTPEIPENVSAPMLVGTAQEGETLTCSAGIWLNTPTSYAYQWTRDDTDITGATANSYLIAANDVGTVLLCRVTATNAAGHATSSSENVVPDPANTPEPPENPTRYCGVSSLSGPLSNSQLIALTSDTASVKGKTVTLSPSDQFVYYAYPSTFGVLTAMFLNGFTGINQLGALTLSTQTVTPAGGAPLTYNVYRTNQLQLGTLQFQFV